MIGIERCSWHDVDPCPKGVVGLLVSTCCWTGTLPKLQYCALHRRNKDAGWSEEAMDGDMAELSAYNHQLSADEVEALAYSCPIYETLPVLLPNSAGKCGYM